MKMTVTNWRTNVSVYISPSQSSQRRRQPNCRCQSRCGEIHFRWSANQFIRRRNFSASTSLQASLVLRLLVHISDKLSGKPYGRHDMAGPNNEGTISTSSSPRLVSEQIGSRKRQKVTRACDACKSKKKRCTGEQPCVPCLRARAKCTYEAQYNRGT